MAGLRIYSAASHALRELPSGSVAVPLASTCRPRGARATPFASMILEALKGMQRDILQCQTPWQRLVRSVTLSAILVREVTGLFSNVPYGIHAISVYRSMKRASPTAEAQSLESASVDGSQTGATDSGDSHVPILDPKLGGMLGPQHPKERSQISQLS